MAIIISTEKQSVQFGNEKVITIGTSADSDFQVSANAFELILEFNEENNTYSVINNGGDIPLFKGQIFNTICVSKISRLIFSNSEQYINFEVIQNNVQNNEPQSLCSDIRKSTTKSKLAVSKDKLDYERTAIIKEVGYKINDLKKKLSQNSKGQVFTHIAMFFGSLVCAFAVNNYICGLSIQESADYIHLPIDIKLWILYTILIFGVMLIFKQGFYGFFYSQKPQNQPKMPKLSQMLLICLSSIMMLGVYAFNLTYYLDFTKNIIFSVLISVFFVGVTICIGVSSGYYKSSSYELSELLNKYEYREDFERVINDYRKWVLAYINTLSEVKKEYVNDKIFKLRIHEMFEIIIGVCTAPFLAYGVSITLANCFPEAAGWIRISGMRFSPVFLVLASFLILFAFFMLAYSFQISRKISNSEVIKHDGFSNYLLHCSEILGLQATNSAKKEMKFALYVAISIILIEFTMNVSYFLTEIGMDLGGLSLSFIAALVPTALLVAETYLLGKTKFEITALEAIKAKADK